MLSSQRLCPRLWRSWVAVIERIPRVGHAAGNLAVQNDLNAVLLVSACSVSGITGLSTDPGCD